MTVDPATITSILRGMERWLPAPRLEDVTDESYEALRQRYRARDRFGNLLVPIVLVVLAGFFYLLLSTLAVWAQSPIKNPRFLLASSKFELGVMAVFMAIFSVGFLTTQGLRAWLGAKEYTIYQAYGAQRYGWSYDAGKLFLWMFVLLFPLLACVGVLRATMFSAFTDDALFESSFGSCGFATQYKYADIRGVYHVEQRRDWWGRDHLEPYYLISFNNGYQWRTTYGAGGPKLEQEAQIVKWVAQQAGKPVRGVRFAEDIPK